MATKPFIMLMRVTLASATFFPCLAQTDTQRSSGRTSNTTRQPVLMLRDPAVQAELKLRNDQKEPLLVLIEEVESALWAARDLPPQESGTKLQPLVAKMNTRLEEILTPFQRTRLSQLVLQSQGPAAMLRAEVSRILALTGEQRQRIQAMVEEAGTGQPQSADEQRRKMYAVLTDEQKKQWSSLLGRTFDPSRLRAGIVRAPELRDVDAWINTSPLTLAGLRGRVVVVHFWTFGCGNCIANYPACRDWQQQYAGKAVTIIGIHTPETAGEHSIESVKKKAQDNNLKFPIAVDNERKNWDAWANNVWPSVYLVDKNGYVRYRWYGELNWKGAGGEKLMQTRIDELLAEKSGG